MERNPSYIVEGDFNGDGKTDLAVSNEASDSVSIMVNDGTGRFSVLNSFAVEFGPYEMVADDFNRDGRPDLAVLKNNPKQLSVLINTGAGRFTNMANFDGTFYARVIPADLNRDSFPDLVMIREGGLTLLTNNAGASFAPSKLDNLPNYLPAVAAEDVNLDGVVDLIFSNSANGGGKIFVCLGEGPGRFVSIANFTAGAFGNFASGAGIGDFNRDGNPDLAVANYNAFGGPSVIGGDVSILLGDGSGGFRLITSVNVGRAPRRVVVNDFNGDGKADLAVTISGESKVVLLTGDGTGFFGIAGGYNTGRAPLALVTGDFNGDGKADLVVTNQSYTGATVLLNNGMGGFPGKTSYYSFSNPTSTAVGDLNKDGAPDLVIATVNGSVSVAFSACRATPQLVSASTASFRAVKLATESIVAAFGANLSATTATADSLPLPTSLAGISVSVKDSLGAERLAPLFFVSPGQINYQIPAGTAEGQAAVAIKNGDAVIASGQAQISRVAPGLFAANANGQGVAAAVVLRVKADGAQVYEPAIRFDGAQNKYVAVPIDLDDESDQVFLLLFGTGLRYSDSPATVTARIGDAGAEVLYTGAQGGFVGLDQVNLRAPRSLIGRGDMNITLTVNGKTANIVGVSIKCYSFDDLL